MIDLTGKTFGNWQVISEAERYVDSKGRKYRRYLCRCKCSVEKIVLKNSLSQGKSKSCGCLQKENGRVFSEEHKKKISEANLKRWSKKDNISRQSKALKKAHEEGRHPMTDAKKNHLDEMIKSNIGRKQTEHQKQAASRAAKLRAKKYLVEGSRITISEASIKYSKKEQFLRDRMSIGWTLEEAALDSRPKYINFKTYRWNGELMSLRDISLQENISFKLLRNRISAGWELDDAIKLPKGGRRLNENLLGIVYGVYKDKNIMYVGKTISSLKARLSGHHVIKYLSKPWEAKILFKGIEREVLDKEIQLIKELNPPLNTSPGGESGGALEYLKFYWNDEQLTLRQLSEISGIPRDTLSRRLVLEQWPIEKAMQQPILKMGQTFPFCGRLLTIKEVSEITGVEENTIRMRMKHKKETIEEASSYPSRNKRKYFYKNEFLTLKQIREKTGLSTGGILNRIEKGIPLDENKITHKVTPVKIIK